MSETKIPKIKRDFPLFNKFLPIIMGGFDQVFDDKGKLYIRLLCRLVDKSFDEYETAREYLLQELKTKDTLSYRFVIINHLENCISALDRSALVFKVARGKSLGNFISKITKKKIEKLNVSNIRNSVEHIEEHISKEIYEKGLFLDVDKNYENICIDNRCISFRDLSRMIEQYHCLVSEIFNSIPNRREGNKFYYDKKF